ncbi:MAG: Phosphoribosylamine--glycine ligase [bacterium]|nr:Phosphoribosylamine--glycine ligase [bacterium]
MRVLILGSGGREHALTWGFHRDPAVTALHIAPGNAGTRDLATSHTWDGVTFERIHELASDIGADLIIPGSEEPLVRGLGDYCREHQLPLIGPDARAARLEGSKAYGKEFCLTFGIPTARAQVFTRPADAWDYVRDLSAPPVIKADGLAAGKGVLLPSTRQEAQEAIAALMVEARFGNAGSTIVVEERLEGFEASLMCATDGTHLVPIADAMDYKRSQDGDAGPNTGGMGVLSPHPRLDRDLQEAIATEIVQPAARGLREWQLDYRGILYIGLMITATGPQVIEFNCRWGDPETQGITPRLRTPLSTLYTAMRDGTLESLALDVADQVSVGVVLAAQGYPDTVTKGAPIDALLSLSEHPEVTLFQAGTAYKAGHLRINGGRVACLVGAGASHRDARQVAYAALEATPIPGLRWRSDIGGGA